MRGPSLSCIAALALAGCTHALPPDSAAAAPGSAPVELVESWPLETSLDHADVPDAKDVWRTMVDSARRRLDFAEFYASDDPGAPTALTPVIEAVERAAARGVKVRWLADARMAKTYPELLARFARAGVDVRRFDAAPTLGGVLHAKYFVADDEAYLGSQNFDWRSLEHIQEVGARVAVPAIVGALGDVFELDWRLAGGDGTRPGRPGGGTGFPVDTGSGQVSFVASPHGWLPDERLWDLPALVALIDSARTSVRAQVLTFVAHGGHGGDFPELEDALKRAAARGVEVELLVSDWSKKASTADGLKALASQSAVKVRFLDVPPLSTRFIPFARVAHAKYLVIDGARAWVGTSNWERDYFYSSRNVGLVLEGGPLPARLDAFFAQNWGSTYAEPLDLTKTYSAPRVSE